jgi:CBS domain-containing protein
MSPRRVSSPLLRDAHVLDVRDSVADAVQAVLESELPALPVAEDGQLRGIFGEREFMEAVFPGYLKELKYAGFVRRSVEMALEKRSQCAGEPVGRYMNTDHVDVDPDFSDAQVAEIFLHHRVLLVPVTDEGSVTGVITRSDFFRAVAERFLER